MRDLPSGPGGDAPQSRGQTHDRRSLSYAGTFSHPGHRAVIQIIETLTARVSILRRVRRFERKTPPKGRAFWRAALDEMGIALHTPVDQIARIPRSGPVVLVANHPHGLVDGMILADLVGRVRDDFRILSRSLLNGIDEEASAYMIPVPFPHEADAQAQMIDMRAKAMAHLKAGGLVALFPSGVVATSDTAFGPVIEAPWNLFTAQMIRRSSATVVPCYFPGANSRAYQIANRIWAPLRQGLLLHEIVHAFDRPQAPVVGHPIAPADLSARLNNPRAFIAWLRDVTLALADAPDQRVGTGSSPE